MDLSKITVVPVQSRQWPRSATGGWSIQNEGQRFLTEAIARGEINAMALPPLPQDEHLKVQLRWSFESKSKETAHMAMVELLRSFPEQLGFKVQQVPTPDGRDTVQIDVIGPACATGLKKDQWRPGVASSLVNTETLDRFTRRMMVQGQRPDEEAEQALQVQTIETGRVMMHVAQGANRLTNTPTPEPQSGVWLTKRHQAPSPRIEDAASPWSGKPSLHKQTSAPKVERTEAAESVKGVDIDLDYMDEHARRQMRSEICRELIKPGTHQMGALGDEGGKKEQKQSKATSWLRL